MTTNPESPKPNDDAKPATLDSTIMPFNTPPQQNTKTLDSAITAVSEVITIHTAYTLTNAVLSVLEYDTGENYEEFPFAFEDGQMLLMMVVNRPDKTPDGFHIFKE